MTRYLPILADDYPFEVSSPVRHLDMSGRVSCGGKGAVLRAAPLLLSRSDS